MSEIKLKDSFEGLTRDGMITEHNKLRASLSEYIQEANKVCRSAVKLVAATAEMTEPEKLVNCRNDLAVLLGMNPTPYVNTGTETTTPEAPETPVRTGDEG